MRRRRLGPGSTPRQALAVAIALLLPRVAEAGDILRAGVNAGRTSGSAAPASPNAAVVDAARANFANSLARTTQTIQALQTMQQTARNLAQRPAPLPKVPDGLAPGGLQTAAGGTWTGAALPTQTNAGGRAQVVVKQSQPQAILTWQTFNVGRQTTLTFDQSAGGKQESQWVAINRITDPSGKPSQILGQINAPGQVYLLNQNGILFGATAQVNTHALVASPSRSMTTSSRRDFSITPMRSFSFPASRFRRSSRTPPCRPSTRPPRPRAASATSWWSAAPA